MKITFQKLCEIFRLRDDRQIRVNLMGRISIIDNQTAFVTDKALAKLFKELETDTVVTLAEASKLYNEAEARIQWLANNGYVSCFKLVPGSRGSKMLFQKSKLDDFFVSKITYLIRERSLAEKRELELLIIQGCMHNKEQWKELLIDFYCNMLSTEAIARKNKVSPQSIRMKIRYATNALSKTFVSMMQSHNDIGMYKKQVHDLELELALYKFMLKEQTVGSTIPGPTDILSQPIDEFRHEMSVRLYNCLTNSLNCMHLYDVIKFTREQVQKHRNVGATTVMELSLFLAKYKLQLKGE